MATREQTSVTERRALLTDREREIVAGEADVADSYRYQTISRIRARFDRLEGDLEALEKHGDLADELREAVCRLEDSLVWEALTEDVPELPEQFADMDREEIKDLSPADMTHEEAETVAEWMISRREAAKKYTQLTDEE